MGHTRQQFVEKALGSVGLASFVYDLTPDQLLDSAERLDAMMAQWNGKGIRLGYPLPGSPELTSLSEETNVPDSANEAIFLNLGIRLAPTFGKTVSQDVKLAAREAYLTLLGRAVQPRDRQLPAMPAGAGHKRTRNAFFSDPPDTVDAGPDGEITLE